MTAGIIYCRVSSKEQIEGTSLESQEAACREYAESKGIHILKVFVEQGESAKFADRTQLLALIDFCREHKGAVQLLLVWKVDRFARNVADHFSVKATLARYGVRIASVTEPIDTNPEGRLMETILAGFAQFDNDVRAMRTVQGMQRKLHEGIFPWGPPLGYKSSVANAEKKTQPDLPDEPTFSLLQNAWRRFATGSYTQSEMRRLMASWGLESAKGKAFSPQSLYQIFTNPYYAGILIDPWNGEEYEGKHAPMVTRQEFANVQRVIAGRNRSLAHQKDRPEFPLRGLVRCDGCVHCLTAAFSRGRSSRYPYYLCYRRGCAKRGKSHAAEEVHADFTSFLNEIAPRPQLIQRIGERIITAASRNEAEITSRRQHRRERVLQLEREVQELIRMRAQNLITTAEFLPQKKRLADRLSELEHSGQHAVKPDQVRADLEYIVAPLANLEATWSSLKPPFRRRFEHLILPGGFVIDKIRTADLGLLFSAFRAYTTNDSSVVPSACLRSNRLWQEIRAFSDTLKGIGEPEPVLKRRFENSHRNRLRWRFSNH